MMNSSIVKLLCYMPLLLLLTACQLRIPDQNAIQLCVTDSTCPINQQCTNGQCVDRAPRVLFDANLEKPVLEIPNITLDMQNCAIDISSFVIPYTSNAYPKEPKAFCINEHLFVLSSQAFQSDFTFIPAEETLTKAFYDALAPSLSSARKSNRLYHYDALQKVFLDITDQINSSNNSITFDQLLESTNDAQNLDIRLLRKQINQDMMAIDDLGITDKNDFVLFFKTEGSSYDRNQGISNLNYLHIRVNTEARDIKAINGKTISNQAYGDYQIMNNKLIYLEKSTIGKSMNNMSYNQLKTDIKLIDFSIDSNGELFSKQNLDYDHCFVFSNRESNELPSIDQLNVLKIEEQLILAFLYQDDVENTTAEPPFKFLSLNTNCNEFQILDPPMDVVNNQFKERALKASNKFILAYSTSNNLKGSNAQKVIQYELLISQNLSFNTFNRSILKLSFDEQSLDQIKDKKLWIYGDSLLIPFEQQFNQSLINLSISNALSRNEKIDPIAHLLNTNEVLSEKTISTLRFYPPNQATTSENNRALVTAIGFIDESVQSYWCFDLVELTKAN